MIQLDRNFGEVKVEGTEIHASAGALLSTIAVAARRASLTGFEFAGGIPGTLGGAVVMNAGAYGGEMKDVLRKVMVMDQSGKVFEIPAEELQMGYRTSIIKTAGYIVLGAVLSLKEGNLEEIKMLTRKLSEQRTSKQPLEYPSVEVHLNDRKDILPATDHGQRTAGLSRGWSPGIGETLRLCDQYRRRYC